uniref:Ras-related protein Rab-28 n=2 Tax=Phaeomonas parva TaxID=124430 RepID=A0A7S1XYC7_9STRA|mmetsp:Transcript_6282/g.17590  ORF Transcript_6282/g.17590 Transcript_6282/m.17590 type:complete len:219 (+) Transcript_6282:135-791(+)
MRRFVDDGFERAYNQTIGVDFLEKKLTLRGDHRVHLQVWDVGGQSISSKMLSTYIKGSNLIFLCYDVTDAQSFADLDDWLGMVHKAFRDPITDEQLPLPHVQVLGNKIDLIGQKVVPDRDAREFAEENKLKGHHLVSAQSGENLLRCMYACAAEMVGITLSEHELAYYDTVLAVTVVEGGGDADPDGGRTPWADEIEAEDLAAERRKQEQGDCVCAVM